MTSFLVAHFHKIEAETIEEAEELAKSAGALHSVVAHDLSALYSKMHNQHVELTDAVKPPVAEAPVEESPAEAV